MNGCGIVDHENVGADFLLQLGFSARVQTLVRNHVSAKRYLCATTPDYYNSLSEASKTTLRFQGGPMSVEEVTAYESDPDYRTYILMRSWDEQAKVPGLPVPPLESYFHLLDSHATYTSPTYMLSSSQLQFWETHHYLKLTNFASYHDISPTLLSDWTNEIAHWSPSHDGKWLLHWEAVGEEGERALCRAENFVNYHEGVRDLCSTKINDVVSQLFREPAVLFKEKINFKMPGGGGFAAHQDSPAYIGMANSHISVMLAIDAATPENGCLEVCPGIWVKDQVPLTPSGVITAEAEAGMQFLPVQCSPGDVLLFSGYLPHRSGPNRTDKSRRAMFITYNPSSDGTFHEQYYAAKHAGVAGFDSAKAISFQGDFQGRIVD